MHESIAQALHRGAKRQLADASNQHVQRTIRRMGPARKSRRRWLQAMLELELSDPAQVLLGYLVAGTGKKAGYLLATCRLIDGGWYGQFIIIDSRKCEVRDRLAKLTISTHVVDRVIQRLGLKDPREAIVRLRVPIVGSIELMGGLRDGEHLLVPAEGGAAVLKRSEEDPKKGVLATFIDQDKLGSNQIAEVEAVQRRIDGTEFASDLLANSVPYNFS